MTTLEKIKKRSELRNETHNLDLEIREEQNKCDHRYSENPLMDSKYFYGRCIKCAYEYQVEHGIDIYNDSDEEIKKEWNKLILIKNEKTSNIKKSI